MSADPKRVSLSLDDMHQTRFNMLAIEYSGGNRSALLRRWIDDQWKRYVKIREEQAKVAKIIIEEELCRD